MTRPFPPELAVGEYNRRLHEQLEELPPGRDPYWGASSHPDVVEFVWDRLGAALPAEARRLFKQRAVLCHPPTGRVVAIPWGTAYAIWLSGDALAEAHADGYLSTYEWSNRTVTDLADDLADPGWVFGRFRLEQESDWLSRSYETLT